MSNMAPVDKPVPELMEDYISQNKVTVVVVYQCTTNSVIDPLGGMSMYYLLLEFSSLSHVQLFNVSLQPYLTSDNI